MSLPLKRSLAMGLTLVVAGTMSACQTPDSSRGPNWVEVKEMQSQGVHIYVDKNAITSVAQQASWRNAFLLNQPEEPQQINSVSFSSSVFSMTVNCEQSSIRFNEVRFYDQPQGQGNVVITMPGNEEFITAQNADEKALINQVCQ